MQQPQQQGSRLAPELKARLADGSIPLPSVFEWWQGEKYAASANGERISTSDMNAVEETMYGILLIEEMCGPSSLSDVVGHPFEPDLRSYWAEVEQARQALLN
jgi:hypothetical protein